ncbi:unnamed protein product, partial [Mesorhabditis spiculigera]
MAAETPPDAAPKTAPRDVEIQSQIGQRQNWDNHRAFLLTCIGYAVGLGNVWRFPYLAYENGGAAFLFPYICCNILFGMPLLYMEFSLGQYIQTCPSVNFYKMKPILQGVGWAMAAISFLIGGYYIMIVAWIGRYLAALYRIDDWTTCKGAGKYKDICYSVADTANADPPCSKGQNYYHGNCTVFGDDERRVALTASQIFLKYEVQLRTDSFTDLGEFSYENAASLFVMWLIVGIVLYKGIESIGWAAHVTATLPYFIIGVLFLRGVTLEGAGKGIQFYLLQPRMEYIANPQTWKAALAQACYSLSVGMGGLQSMASYNDRRHNALRDAAFVAGADIFMSIFGGVAVYSVLGHLATIKNQDVDAVVESGVTLAFVTYPEAISTMPGATIWAGLFFLMLFLLGIIYMETVATTIQDQWPVMKKHRTPMLVAICICGWLSGLIMCFGAGVHWLEVWDTYTGMALTFICFSEIVGVSYLYGWQNFRHDLESMFGQPSGTLGKYFGQTGYYFFMDWLAIAPVMGLLMIIFSFTGDFDNPIILAKAAEKERLFGSQAESETDIWAKRGFGIAMAILVVCWIPLVGVCNIIRKSQSGDIGDAFRPQENHPSYKRLVKEAEAGLETSSFFDNMFNVGFGRADASTPDATNTTSTPESASSMSAVV